jgi:hypothetical protein
MITELRIGFARTINLGNYESCRVEASVAVSLMEGDDIKEAKESAQAELNLLLKETYTAQFKEKKS